MPEIDVYAPGTIVYVNESPGHILQLTIAGEAMYVLYEVSWWSAGIRNQAWLHRFEFRTESLPKKIGLHSKEYKPKSSGSQ